MNVFPKTIYPQTVPGNRMLLLPRLSTMVESSGNISKWGDISGRGFSGIQGTGADQPNTLNVGIGTVAQFNGTSDILTVANNTCFNVGFTMILVFNCSNVVTGGNLVMRDASGAVTGTFYVTIADSSIKVQVRNTGGPVIPIASDAIANNQTYIATIKNINGQPLSVSINNAAPVVSGHIVNYTTVVGDVAIGRRPTLTSGWFPGWVGALQVINGDISSTVQTNLVRYYADVLGVSL